MIIYLIYFIGVIVAYVVMWSIGHQINKNPDTMPHDRITKSALLTWIPAISLFSWLLVACILIYAIVYGLVIEISKIIGEYWLNSEI